MIFSSDSGNLKILKWIINKYLESNEMEKNIVLYNFSRTLQINLKLILQRNVDNSYFFNTVKWIYNNFEMEVSIKYAIMNNNLKLLKWFYKHRKNEWIAEFSNRSSVHELILNNDIDITIVEFIHKIIGKKL